MSTPRKKRVAIKPVPVAASKRVPMLTEPPVLSERLRILSTMDWKDIESSPRETHGFEMMPVRGDAHRTVLVERIAAWIRIDPDLTFDAVLPLRAKERCCLNPAPT